MLHIKSYPIFFLKSEVACIFDYWITLMLIDNIASRLECMVRICPRRWTPFRLY